MSQRQPLLTQSEKCSSQADAIADMDINGIGEALAGHAARRLALPFHEITFLFAVPGLKVADAKLRVNTRRPVLDLRMLREPT